MNKKLKPDDSMDFEFMLRQFFGDKAYHTCDNRNDKNSMKKWLRKVLEKITNQIDKLDTTIRHKKMLMHQVEKLKLDLKTKDTDPWSIIIHLFALISRLLGYDYCRAYINTPIYFQDSDQYYTQKIFEGGGEMLCNIIMIIKI